MERHGVFDAIKPNAEMTAAGTADGPKLRRFLASVFDATAVLCRDVIILPDPFDAHLTHPMLTASTTNPRNKISSTMPASPAKSRSLTVITWLRKSAIVTLSIRARVRKSGRAISWENVATLSRPLSIDHYAIFSVKFAVDSRDSAAKRLWLLLTLGMTA